MHGVLYRNLNTVQHNAVYQNIEEKRLKLHIVNVSFQVFVVPSFSGLVILFCFSFVLFRSFLYFIFKPVMHFNGFLTMLMIQ